MTGQSPTDPNEEIGKEAKPVFLPDVPTDQAAIREGLCQICNAIYPVWFAPNELWNELSDKWHFLCPTCFTKLAEKAGTIPTAWLVTTENLTVTHDRALLEGLLVEAERMYYSNHTTAAEAVPVSVIQEQLEGLR